MTGTSLLRRLAWLYRAPAVIFATLLLLAVAYFGSSRDFGAFVLSVPVLAVLLLCTLAATVWAACIKSQRRRAMAALVLICLTPLVQLASYGMAQRVRFLLWAPAHYRQLGQASRKDGIIMGWDSWGMGGEDTASYLVVDTQDRLASKARADQWTRQIGQSCGMWETQRMWPKFYVVTTFTDCPYEVVPPAG